MRSVIRVGRGALKPSACVTPANKPAPRKLVERAATNVAKGLTPQGEPLDNAELLSLLWECSLDESEAFIAAHWGTATLREAVAQAKAKLASKPLNWTSVES